MSLFGSCALIGGGKSNTALAEYLLKKSISVVFRDKNLPALPPSLSSNPKVKVVYGEKYLNNLFEEVIFLSPSVRPDIKEIEEARARGAVISSESELFSLLCPCPVIAITGSDGKTTTATLCQKMLEAAGHRTHLVGNIGVPAISVIEKIKPSDFAVIELSSFQLFSFSPESESAIITNLTQNHLDWHASFAEYKGAKLNIYKNSKRRIVNADSKHLKDLKYENEIFFTTEKSKEYMMKKYKGKDFGYIDGSFAVFYVGGTDVRLFSLENLKIKGRHNISNALSAALLIYPFVGLSAISASLCDFSGVLHRCTYLGHFDGRDVYESSIDTTPSRCAATLDSLNRKCTLILGGRGKNLSFAPMLSAVKKYAGMTVATGENGESIRDFLIAHAYPKKILNISGILKKR